MSYIKCIKKDLNNMSKNELEALRHELNLLMSDVIDSIDLIRKSCEHKVVVLDGNLDHHNGGSTELVCKSCNKTMYSHEGNYYPYPISAPRDSINRILEGV